MKRVCGIIMLLLAVISFNGCQLPELNLQNLTMIKSFSCDLSVVASGKEYYCHFVKDDGRAEITVKKPETIEGLSLVCENDIYSVSFKGITVSLDASDDGYIKYFADGFIKNLEDTFSSETLSPKYENNEVVYEGFGEYGEYTVKFDVQGKFLSMEIPSVDVKITAENFEF